MWLNLGRDCPSQAWPIDSLLNGRLVSHRLASKPGWKESLWQLWERRVLVLRIFRPSYPGELTDFRGLIAAGFLGRCDIHYGEIINCHNYEIITLKKKPLLSSSQWDWIGRGLGTHCWARGASWQEKLPGSCGGPGGFLNRRECWPGWLLRDPAIENHGSARCYHRQQWMGSLTCGPNRLGQSWNY